jgi:hypothetical protein
MQRRLTECSWRRLGFFCLKRVAETGALPSWGSLSLYFRHSDYRGLRAATDAVPLPEPEPGAVGVHLIVPSIRSRDIASGQWSRVRRREDTLQPLDIGNDLLNVHPCQYNEPAGSAEAGQGSTPCPTSMHSTRLACVIAALLFCSGEVASCLGRPKCNDRPPRIRWRTPRQARAAVLRSTWKDW